LKEEQDDKTRELIIRTEERLPLLEAAAVEYKPIH